MVQFIQSNQPKPKSLGTQLLEGLTEGALGGYQTYLGQKEKNRLIERENRELAEKKAQEARKIQAYEKLGLPPGIEPQVAAALLKENLKTQRSKQLLEALGGQPSDGQTEPQSLGGLGASDRLLKNVAQESAAGEEAPSWLDEFGIEPEQRPAAQQMMSAWERMTDAQRAAVAQLDPGAANMLEKGREFNQRIDLQKKEFEFRKAEAKRKEQIDFHKESAKYDEDLLEKEKTAKKQMAVIKDLEKTIDKINPKSAANIFKGFGEVGDKISNAFLSGEEAKLLSSIPYLIEGWKDIFGVRLSDADLRVIQDKLPSLGKSPEANKAILNIMKKYSEMSLLRSKIGREIKEKNKGLRPLGYADEIEKQYENMIAPVKVISPKTGNIIEIPAYKLSDAVKAGAKVVNE